MANAENKGSTPAGTGASTPQPNPARDFDRAPEPNAAPMSPEEQAAADAIERYAQENAQRARQRLLAERAAREAQAKPTAGGPGAAAPEPVPPPAPFQPTPGKERWPVKTVTDNTWTQANSQQVPTVTTVEDMWLVDRPQDMPLTRAVPAYQSQRVQGPETTIWQIKGTIIAYKWEQDGDYHIVLQGDTSGYTMIVEAPQDGNDANGNPFVGAGSPLKGQIEAARQKLQQRLNPTPAFANASIPVQITGIGFFDILHGQTGVATTNAIELHPILDVQFLDQ